jgi:hypothetical protein
MDGRRRYVCPPAVVATPGVRLIYALLVLTWISIYWFSRAGPTAAGRLYYENRVAMLAVANAEIDATLPVGFSYFPKELFRAPST